VQVAETGATLLGATPEQIGEELPSWLQELTPSEPASPQGHDDAQFAPFSVSSFPGQPDQSHSIGAPVGGVDGATAPPDPPQPFGPAVLSELGDFGMGAPGMGAPVPGPVGPFSDLSMPSPEELPGGMDGFGHQHSNSAQPWYLQGSKDSSPHANGSAFLDSTMLKSTSLHSAMLTSSMTEEALRKTPVATMPCPNCQMQVNETSLACPNCRYSFFVNCPFCHELIDTTEAVPDQLGPCPYCHKEVDRWSLGRGGIADLVSQKHPGSRPADSGPAPDPAFPAMKQTLHINVKEKKGLNFGWLVDLLWLIAIVAMVWALTQLPTWLHLSGQY
jgi:hypothetical protein